MSETRPPLAQDRSFHGMVATQFLGAFNDNVYKQLVLLLSLDYMALQGLQEDPYQATANLMFAVAFIAFSGFAGWLSDRYSKRRMIVLSKVAEIGVMLLGALTFFLIPELGQRQMILLIAILFLMGTQSAFFGPSKYGVLPELFRDRDLPTVNGIIQMTTFLAIILGIAVCGLLKENLQKSGIGLWPIITTCIGLAVLGTLTAMQLRPTPPAQPGLPFRPEAFAMDRTTFQLLTHDKKLLHVMGAVVLFWFLGGVTLPVTNTLGKEQFALGDGVTSLLTACIGLGIAVGCVISGSASRKRIRFGFVRAGAAGMCLSLLLLFMVSKVLAPPSQIVQFWRADTWRQTGRYEDALREYAGLLAIEKPSIEAWIGAGLAHRGLGQEEQARQHFDRARELDATATIPSDVASHFAPHVGAQAWWGLVPLLALLLTTMGVSAGVFAVPLQVFLQHRPPKSLKGRMIAAMNLLTWIGIALSAAIYLVFTKQFSARGIGWSFLVCSLLILPLSLFYQPEDEELAFD